MQKDSQIFDDYFVKQQLDAFGVIPLLKLLQHGYSAQLPYDAINLKLIKHIPNEAVLCSQYFYQDVLNLVGCLNKNFSYGRTQIFFRPKNEKFVNCITLMTDSQVIELAKRVQEKYHTRKNINALWTKVSIVSQFIGKCKFNAHCDFQKN